MTVREFYEAMGRAGDWLIRRKIEKAVFSFKIRWKQQIDDNVRRIIVEEKTYR